MKDLDESEKEKFLETIISEADRMERLISQVLDLEKIQSGRIKLNIEEIDLKELIEEACDSMQQVLQKHNIDLEFELQDLDFQIEADRDRITQVVLNLISNAVKWAHNPLARIQEVTNAPNRPVQEALEPIEARGPRPPAPRRG